MKAEKEMAEKEIADKNNSQDVYELVLPGTRQRHLDLVQGQDILESAFEEVRNWKKGKLSPAGGMGTRRQGGSYDSRTVPSRMDDSGRFEEMPPAGSRSRIMSRLDELLKDDKQHRSSRVRMKEIKDDVEEGKKVKFAPSQQEHKPKSGKDSVWEAVNRAEQCFDSDDVIKGIDHLMDAIAANPEEPRYLLDCRGSAYFHFLVCRAGPLRKGIGLGEESEEKGQPSTT
eukprot:767149-Hanusia_phi.AAC.2